MASDRWSVYVWMMSSDRQFKDAISSGPLVRGRGAGLNPGSRFEDVRLHVLGEHLEEIAIEHPDGVRVATRVYRDRSRTILNEVESPDLPFRWTVNPYRGCEHGCIYCYARPGHEYLGLSSGLDFETKILAKPDAADLLRAEISRDSWTGEGIVLSGVTDPYQPVERSLGITRRVLQVCVEFAQPVSLVTKNALVTRDVDLVRELATHRAVHAAVSVTTLDHRLARVMEPRASAPSARLNAIETLASAGVPVTVMVAPVIPGLNDQEIPAILKAARDAGACSAGYVLLRLPHQIKELFLDWLKREWPDRAARVESAIRETRDGELYNSDWGVRQRGTGVRARQIADLFALVQRQLGLDRRPDIKDPREFLRRTAERQSRGQLGLFGETAQEAASASTRRR